MLVDNFLDFRQHRIHAAHVGPCLSVCPVVIRIRPDHETVVVHPVHSGLVQQHIRYFYAKMYTLSVLFSSNCCECEVNRTAKEINTVS